MPGVVAVAFQEPTGITLEAPKKPILLPFTSRITGFLGFLQIPSGAHPVYSRFIRNITGIHQGICAEIQGMVVCKGHYVDAHFVEQGYLFRRQAEGKRLSSAAFPLLLKGNSSLTMNRSLLSITV